MRCCLDTSVLQDKWRCRLDTSVARDKWRCQRGPPPRDEDPTAGEDVTWRSIDRPPSALDPQEQARLCAATWHVRVLINVFALHRRIGFHAAPKGAPWLPFASPFWRGRAGPAQSRVKDQGSKFPSSKKFGVCEKRCGCLKRDLA